MTNEEMQKMMEFILQRQATFTVNLERLNEAQQRTEKTLPSLLPRKRRWRGSRHT
jgi:hypothetical protein